MPQFHIGYTLGYDSSLRVPRVPQNQGPVSRNPRKLFGPEKPFVKLRPGYCVKLVFSCVVKGIKIKIKAKFRSLRRLRFEDTKRIMSPEMFRDFRETGPSLQKHLLAVVSDGTNQMDSSSRLSVQPESICLSVVR